MVMCGGEYPVRDGSDTGGFISGPSINPEPNHAMELLKKLEETDLTAISIIDSAAFQAAQREVRYVVERRPGSWFWKRWQVRPHDATGVLFSGTEYQCLSVQQSLHCAAGNGAWVALNPKYHV